MFNDVFTPAVGETEAVGALRTHLLDVLFDQMPIGMGVLDRSLTVLRANDTWKAFLERYAPLSNTLVVAGETRFFDLFPEERERFLPALMRAFDGRVVREEALKMQRDGVTSYWDVVITPQRHDGEILTLLLVVTDASDRVFANRLLEEKEMLYRGIFEATSDGVTLLSPDGRIAECNPAACEMFGYPYEEMIGRDPNEFIRSDDLDDTLRDILQGTRMSFEAVNYRRNGEAFNVEVRSNAFYYRGEPHILSVVRDVTERVHAFQLLESRVEERTRELSTLLQASNKIASTLALPPLLNQIVDELKFVIDYTGAAIYTLDDVEDERDALNLLLYCGPIPQEYLSQTLKLERGRPFSEVIFTGEPVIIANMETDTPLARRYRELAGEHRRYVRSWMGIPLIVRERVIGMLSFDSDTPDYFNSHLANVALAFANQAAAAMDNARLYELEQERRYETEQRRLVAEGMRDTLANINSNRSLGDILDFIVAQAGRLLGTDSIALFMYEPESEVLNIQTAIGLDEDMIENFQIRAGYGAAGRALAERRSAIIPDLSAVMLAHDDPQKPVVERWAKRFAGLLAVPMVAKDELYGAIVLYYPAQHEFTEEEIQLVTMVCDQAALAIENARLRAQAAQTAVAAERSRLARDLHDAVTQTLFSASLIAEVLPRLWERDREEGLRRLADLRQLTRGALAEMRTLLLELRPATLTEVELRELLRQLGEALTGRARIPVTLEVVGEARTLPPDVQIAFYRVAQESLHNIFKHAGATAVSLRLDYESDMIRLTITDNGCGFDPDCVAAESLGLRGMRERAEGIGAELALTVPPEGGTRISLGWSGGRENAE